MHSECIIH